MLTLLLGSKKDALQKKSGASIDEKRMEVFLKSDFARRF